MLNRGYLRFMRIKYEINRRLTCLALWWHRIERFCGFEFYYWTTVWEVPSCLVTVLIRGNYYLILKSPHSCGWLIADDIMACSCHDFVCWTSRMVHFDLSLELTADTSCKFFPFSRKLDRMKFCAGLLVAYRKCNWWYSRVKKSVLLLLALLRIKIIGN